ncbi:MAG TPA: prepilin-type N-terminal cleavage/methylation domain-containing protein [Gemmatimonadaceae bacterium]|nr:prepilin-type N-terminal cleavage/methylation domain-containing protein [Gemmatimonadaceae bacterium]
MTVRRKRSGFSLAEILVAIAIIAVVAAVVIPSIGGQLRSGDESRTQQDLTNIRSGIEQFLADVRRYPKNVGQLVKLPSANNDTALVGGEMNAGQIGRWKGPYVNKDSAATLRTGFDLQINPLFTSELWSGQAFLTISMATAIDTASARSLDRKMDDGVDTTGTIQWSLAAATTTIKYFALPIQ